MNQSIELCEAVLEGRLSSADVAAQLGLTQAQVEERVSLLGFSRVAAERAQAQRQRRSMHLVMVASVVVAMGAGVALAAGTCNAKVPYCFSANQPALADQVNANFDQALKLVEAKVGAVGGGDGGVSTVGVATTTLTTTGNITSGGNVTATGAMSAGGNVAVGGALTVTGNGTVSGAMTLNGVRTSAFGGLYSVEAASPITVCPYGSSQSYSLTNPVTGGGSCPANFNDNVVYRLDFCQPNVGSRRVELHLCSK